MRHPSLGVTATALTLFALAACNKPAPAAHDDLAADLASASSNDLALAPTTAGRSTVSAAEQLSTHTTVAPSRRSAPHRTPRVARHQSVATPAPQPVEQVADASPAPAPLIMAPRPHQMSPAAPSPSNGGVRGSDIPGGAGGAGDGQTIGTIWGVVIRGGGVDGDHCDPRAGHPGRRRFGAHI